MTTASKAASERAPSNPRKSGAGAGAKRAATKKSVSKTASATAVARKAAAAKSAAVPGATRPVNVSPARKAGVTPTSKTAGKTADKTALKRAAAVPTKVARPVKAPPAASASKPAKTGKRTRTTKSTDTLTEHPAAPDDAEHPVATLQQQLGELSPSATRPDYWDQACADLVKRDRIMKKLIPQFGPVHLINRGDPFSTLARSIVGQQISVQAAQAIWLRIEGACLKVAPARVVKLGYDLLFGCGLSKRKAEYILDLAQHFVDGSLHVDRWASMDDEAVIAELVQIRGIGRWTAEMFLIFNLSRPDILPLDDIGLIRAISVNYFSGEPVTRSEAREVAANWEPWRTVATWYMWRSLDPLPVDY